MRHGTVWIVELTQRAGIEAEARWNSGGPRGPEIGTGSQEDGCWARRSVGPLCERRRVAGLSVHIRAGPTKVGGVC
eukprot:7990568-Pyramimonas_sp.AAC.1